MHRAFAGSCCRSRGKETCGLQGVEVLYVRHWLNDVDLFPHANDKLNVFVYGHSVFLHLQWFVHGKHVEFD